MSLKSDDPDIRPAEMITMLGGNGDFYITIMEELNDGTKQSATIRVSTSGGVAPLDVRLAVANLYRAMEKHDLNKFSEDE
ncbi:MAG: hypothetical protein JWQ09_5043 [Segetibacter sp.]|nr:hypothetical protein [Segetibacter sp.]